MTPPSATTPAELSARLRAAALESGFDLVGIVPAVAPPGLERFREWLAAGFAGEMGYLARRADAYAHPEGVLPTARSVVVVGLSYRTEGPPDSLTPRQGRVARYAWGTTDYHTTIREMLRPLAALLHAARPGCVTRGVVDTAPLLERDFAKLAGLGWFGKNTLILNKRAGSLFLVGALLTDVELEPDAPHETSHCGTCTRCLDACPTDAFPEPGVLDARRCISYLTIEHRGLTPPELRPLVGDWLFGCDVCQDVCPWNRKALPSSHPTFVPVEDLRPADALRFLEMTDAEFKKRFRGTPLERPGRAGLARNAATVLANGGCREAIHALTRALDDPDVAVRGTAAWALGVLGGIGTAAALRARRAIEDNAEARREIDHAIARLEGAGERAPLEAR